MEGKERESHSTAYLLTIVHAQLESEEFSESSITEPLEEKEVGEEGVQFESCKVCGM